VPEHRWDDVVLIEPTDPPDGDPPAVRGSGLHHLVDEASDPLVREFWLGDMPRAQRSQDYWDMAAWFRSKFEHFRSVRPLRGVLGQRTSSVHLTRIMDRGGLVLANLFKKLLGEYNARLLGFVVFARLWAATLTRITRPQGPRQPFFVHLDEAQTIKTWSLPAILSEARKYGVGATLANQYSDQIPVALHESVLGNVGTTIAFRSGAKDAAAFASHYNPKSSPRACVAFPTTKRWPRWGRAAADIDAEFVDRYENQREESLGPPTSTSGFPDPAAAMRRSVTQYLDDPGDEA
jgi:hypothetical protein